MDLIFKHVLLPGWVLGEKAISHTEKVVLAAIFGFCQDDTSDFHGSLRYLCELTDVKQTSSMCRILKRLVEKGYLTRHVELLLEGKKIHHFRVNPHHFQLLNAANKHPLSDEQHLLPDEQYNIARRTTIPLLDEQTDKKVDKKEIINSVVFKKPTVREVQDFCQQKGYNLDAEHFVAYYESVGWKVGSHPMKSWRHAIITWLKKNQGKQLSLHTADCTPTTDTATYSGPPLPDNAPPRPSPSAQWDFATNSWTNFY